MPTDAYSIADLARLSGLNVRTIRYYLAQGLLPASGESGPGAHYGKGHLDRLRLTKRLQAQHLPLSEIRRRLAELSDTDVAGLVATAPEPASAPTTSALEYVRGLLGASFAERAISMPTPATPQAPTPPTPPTPAPPAQPRPMFARARHAAMGIGSELPPAVSDAEIHVAANAVRQAAARTAVDTARPAELTGAGMPSEPAKPAGPERSQWERLELSPNIELNVRRPLSRLEQKRVERLITIARQVLKEDMQ
jgi:DNA-binding transcriptional MerR regulator